MTYYSTSMFTLLWYVASRPGATAVAETAGQGHRFIAQEVERFRKDGSTFIALINSNLITGSDGKPAYMAATMIDITEYNVAKKALVESENMARILLDTPVDSMLLLDTDYKIVTLNQIASKRFNLTQGEMMGKCVFDFMVENVAESRRKRFDEVKRTKKSIRSIIRSKE